MSVILIVCFILGCLMGLVKLYGIRKGNIPGITESKSIAEYFLK